MANIVMAGLLGVALSTLQLLLMRRVFNVKTNGGRLALMLLKVPLWAAAFVGVGLWWGTGPLLAFGIVAGSSYMAVAILYYVRTRSGVHKEE